MKLVWSPDTALKAYIYTVKSCGNFKESGVPELLSAMAAGWNAKLIVESWSYGGSMATSIGLAVAAHHTCGRHVCIVMDERSRTEYIKSIQGAGMTKTEVIVGEAKEVMAGLAGVDFLVVDCKRRDFVRVLRFAKLSHEGAVLVRKNAFQSTLSGFRWHGVLEKGTHVVRSVFLPVGKGLDIVNVGSSGGGVASSKRSPSHWIRCIDQKSGEEHVFGG
ncbi:hypothetical protein P3X46_003811 [Hevea brasiliensis]|uniref:Uncharacterized protein n=1 Tax=Hevea brasiliensis TaxID=3981 RepID=A0ABQ9NC64_HEVBR|nr:uncharacterized protein LOC110662987 [Hevea brasiliensis]KAJ9188454.1 hypothetical protein P3X46_003811 [Hevea brasiliensis]